jgi:hypothetical protein
LLGWRQLFNEKVYIRSIDLLQWYINITITIVDIIHRRFFCLKYNFLGTGSVSVFKWNLLRWAQYIDLIPVSGPETEGWMVSRIVVVILIYHRHKPADIISLLGS